MTDNSKTTAERASQADARSRLVLSTEERNEAGVGND